MRELINFSSEKRGETPALFVLFSCIKVHLEISCIKVHLETRAVLKKRKRITNSCFEYKNLGRYKTEKQTVQPEQNYLGNQKEHTD